MHPALIRGIRHPDGFESSRSLVVWMGLNTGLLTCLEVTPGAVVISPVWAHYCCFQKTDLSFFSFVPPKTGIPLVALANIRSQTTRAPLSVVPFQLLDDFDFFRPVSRGETRLSR